MTNKRLAGLYGAIALSGWIVASNGSAQIAAPAAGAAPVPAPEQAAPATPAQATAPAAPVATPTVAPAATPPGGALLPVTQEVLHAALSSWGCQASEVLEIAGRWYAACGAGGVYIVERREGSMLVLSGRRQGLGEARSLFMRGGSLWVESTQVEARPLSDLPPVASTGGEPPEPSGRAPALPSDELAPPQHRSEAGTEPSLIAPTRARGVLALEGAFKPFLPISTLAFAVLLDASATYYGERDWYVQGRVFPLGGSIGRGRDHGVYGALATAGYDHQYFGVGLGFGVLRHLDGYNGSSCDSRGNCTYPEDRPGFVIGQQARLGALDGLHMRLNTVFVLDDDRWRFGLLELQLQVPINDRTWLVGGGAGGEQAAFFSGELGLRRLMLGARERGGVFIRPSVGVAGIDSRADTVSIGPMVAVHVEWRK